MAQKDRGWRSWREFLPVNAFGSTASRQNSAIGWAEIVARMRTRSLYSSSESRDGGEWVDSG
jgi:hypothetical protein